MKGIILYKDMVDLKTPYIYFINAIASLMSYKHIGLYFIEVMVQFFTLYTTYKLLLLFVKKNALALLGSIAVSFLLNNSYITLGMSKVECYCLPFIMHTFYMATCYFFDDKKVIDRKNAFIYGLFAGISTMFNLKTAFFFIVLYIIIFVRMLIKKEKILDKILFLIFGGIISVLPYLIYMIVTGSMSYAIYCIFNLSASYVSRNASYEYVSNNFLESMIYFVTNHKLFFAFIFISLIVVIVKCKNKWIKASYIATLIITLFYVSVANKSYVYYLVIFYPYFIPLYIFIAKMMQKIFKENVVYAVSVTCAALLISLNFIVGYSRTKAQYNARCVFNYEMKKVVTKYVNHVEDKKVLALAFNPEVYMALGCIPSFPCFITMNNTYEATPNLFNQQAKYVDESLADVVIIRPSSTFLNFPEPMKERIYESLNKNYTRVEDVDSKSNYGIYNIYIKNSPS